MLSTDLAGVAAALTLGIAASGMPALAALPEPAPLPQSLGRSQQPSKDAAAQSQPGRLALATSVAPASLLSQGATQAIAAATLLPNWLSSQGSVLELAQPVSLWISALNPFTKAMAGSALPPSHLSQLPKTFVCIEAQPSASKTTVSRGFSDWLHRCLLSNLDSKPLRKSLAKDIESAFREVDLAGAQIEPTLAENLPAIRLGDRLLFIITPEIAESAGENGEVLATRWSNQLRLALGDEPMTLLQSQFAMHGLKPTDDYIEGEASWYGPYFHGRLTATGEIYDQDMFTAAHKELPFDTYLKVTNLSSGEQLIVRINDRGPYVGDRILDLSHGAADYLGAKGMGVVPIRAELLEPEAPLRAELPSYRSVTPQQDPLITMWRP